MEKKCVLTILKAINRETIKTEFSVPQDMRECRVHQEFTFMECAHVSSVVTETDHNVAVCLSRSRFETQQVFKD